ncbi:MAG: hypothetical protein JW832_13400 [Deltaproteobacteria bacterium]|nr:hypothetical protein [Deltaproteobacteria bacterium]
MPEAATCTPPDVKTYSTFEEFRQLAIRSLDTKEKKIYYCGAVENLAAVFDEEFDRGFYIPTRASRGIALQMLIPDRPEFHDYKKRDAGENRETRFLRAELAMDTSYMVYDDTVIFFSDAATKRAFEVVSPYVAKTMKDLFMVIWRMTP